MAGPPMDSRGYQRTGGTDYRKAATQRVRGRYTKDAKGQRTYHADMGGETKTYGPGGTGGPSVNVNVSGGTAGPRTSNRAAADYIKRMT